MNKSGFYAWTVFLGILILLGASSFYTQSVEGHYVTGISKQVPWGIYVAGFVFLVGISAGSTLIGLLVHAFGRVDYKPLGTRALLVGLFSLLGSMLLIMADVGAPLKMALIPWVLRNPTSIFFYTSLAYDIFGAILLAELYYALKITRGQATDGDKQTAKWLAIIALPFALVALAALDGALFGFVKARELWNNPLLPAHFVVAALVTGTAILILVAVKRKLVGENTLNHMGKLLGVFIAVTIFFDFFDLLILKYSATPEGIEAWGLLTGRHALLLALNVGGLIVALLIVMFKNGRTTVAGLSVASLLALGAIAAYRYNLVIVGQEVPLLPNLPVVHYSATGTEISVLVGVVALVMFCYSVATRILPMEEAES